MSSGPYELWTLGSIGRLNGAPDRLLLAVIREERRAALRAIEEAHEQAVDVAQERMPAGAASE